MTYEGAAGELGEWYGGFIYKPSEEAISTILHGLEKLNELQSYIEMKSELVDAISETFGRTEYTNGFAKALTDIQNCLRNPNIIWNDKNVKRNNFAKKDGGDMKYVVFDEGGCSPIAYGASEKWFDSIDDANEFALKRITELFTYPCSSVLVFQVDQDLSNVSHDIPPKGAKILMYWSNTNVKKGWMEYHS